MVPLLAPSEPEEGVKLASCSDDLSTEVPALSASLVPLSVPLRTGAEPEGRLSSEEPMAASSAAAVLSGRDAAESSDCETKTAGEQAGQGNGSERNQKGDRRLDREIVGENV